MQLTDKQKGIGLALLGVLFITPDSLLVRLISLDSCFEIASALGR